MKITLEPDVIESLESITGKKISRNGNEIIREVTEIVEKQQNPDTPCCMESNCSEEEEVKEKKLQ